MFTRSLALVSLARIPRRSRSSTLTSCLKPLFSFQVGFHTSSMHLPLSYSTVTSNDPLSAMDDRLARIREQHPRNIAFAVGF